MAVETFIFIANYALLEFFGNAVVFRETPLSVVCDPGPHQIALTRIDYGRIVRREKRLRDPYTHKKGPHKKAIQKRVQTMTFF
jgi:hypothetical protein